MTKNWFGWLMVAVMVIGLGGPQVAHAQGGDDSVIAYGDSVNGEISNRTFEEVFSFEGEAGDLVVIAMDVLSGDFDAYLYLTTEDNEVVAQNDSIGFYNNATIVASLPDTATYLIVATRYSGRSGYGGGRYSLSLNEANPVRLDSVIEGTSVYGRPPTVHLFAPEAGGAFTITYNHVSGTNFPDVVVSRVDPTYGYNEDVATLGGYQLAAGSMTLYLEADALYSIVTRDSYYDYSGNTGDSGVYTLVISAAGDASEPEPQATSAPAE